ncbi:methyltransferase domain-containing protein, partial [Thermomonospora catenispora]|uniref:methyltransferase domain-containing protein n=1 Tax=Thermomonospora catenispora TaxID=2493090 RepID=UPI0030C888FD
MNWAVATYDSAFGYVSAHGAPLVDLLDPQPDERIIDLGCGTGTLAAAIAERGATVLGIDGSPEMIAQASATYPDLNFAVGDAHTFTTSEPYDAVASNAALHWMTRDPDAVLKAVHAALRPGGRFVAEMGGAGNCAELIAAMQTAWRIFGLDEPELPWYFPTPAEYATRLEKAGFTVRLLEYFDRPTRMTEGPNGAADWVRVFAASALKEVPPDIVEPLLARINELAAPALRRESGWVADYVRLRFAAVRKPDSNAPKPEGPSAHGHGAHRGGAPAEGPVTIRTRPAAPGQEPGAPPPPAQAHGAPPQQGPQGSPAPGPAAPGGHPGGPGGASHAQPQGTPGASAAHPPGPHGMSAAPRPPAGTAPSPHAQPQGAPPGTGHQQAAPAGAPAAYPHGAPAAGGQPSAGPP